MRVLHLSLIVVVLVTPCVAHAQARDYSALRDSLSRETSTYALRERIASFPTTGPAETLTERGFLLLRLYQLTNDEEIADEARETFSRAIDAEPAAPWAHYGLAVSLADGPEIAGGPGILRGLTVRQTLAEIQGNDPRSQARESLQRALDVDPAFTPAAVELAELALETHEPGELSVAREALVGLPPASISTLRASLALSDVEAALGNLKSAEKAAEAAVSASADVSAPAGALDDEAVIARHAHAVSLLRQPGREEAGAAIYFDALESLTPAGAERFYRDAEWLATDAEQFRWRTAEPEQHAGWLREFWTLRAAQSGLTPARRLAEHYRRLALAHSRYLRSQHRGAPPSAAVLLQRDDERPLFDDRGLVYIRYGEPGKVVATTGDGLLPNESWLYTLPDGGRLYFHFAALRGGQDFTLIDDLFAVMDGDAEIESVIGLFEDRMEFDERYPMYVTRLRGIQSLSGASNDLSDRMRTLERSYMSDRGRYRKELLAALENELAAPAFEREMPFYYDVYAFKGENDRTALTATFAVPGNMVEPLVTNGRTVYSLQASFIVIDTLQREIQRVDSVFRFAARRRLQSGEYIRFDLHLAARPSAATTHRVVVRNASIAGEGQMYGGPVEITDFATGELRLSEIVLARTDGDGAWRRGNARLALLPPRQFEKEEPFRVFYEIYNLGDRATYSTHINVKPTEGGGILGALKGLFGAGQGEVDLRFDDVASDDRYLGGVQELRDLAADFEPGRYSITITVTEALSGRTATRERMFIVLPDNDDG